MTDAKVARLAASRSALRQDPDGRIMSAPRPRRGAGDAVYQTAPPTSQPTPGRHRNEQGISYQALGRIATPPAFITHREDESMSKIPGATHAEIAALDFAAEQFNITKAQRIERAREMTESIHGAMLIALELLVLDKSALVARVREEHDELGAALLPLASACDAAETLRDLIGSAECRLAVALANVEPDEETPRKPRPAPSACATMMGRRGLLSGFPLPSSKTSGPW
jgi:hypothetical protein